LFNKGFIASIVQPASTSEGGHFKAVSDNNIKYKVQQRLLSLPISLKRGVIRPYLISSINTFYKAIIVVNKR
jgi:hypothetical protein